MEVCPDCPSLTCDARTPPVQTRGFMKQRLAEEINAFMLRMRAAYRIAKLPMERNKFTGHLRSGMMAARGNIRKHSYKNTTITHPTAAPSNLIHSTPTMI